MGSWDAIFVFGIISFFESWLYGLLCYGRAVRVVMVEGERLWDRMSRVPGQSLCLAYTGRGGWRFSCAIDSGIWSRVFESEFMKLLLHLGTVDG